MGTTGYAVISDCGIDLSQLKVSEPFALSAASNAIANVLQNLHSPFNLDYLSYGREEGGIHILSQVRDTPTEEEWNISGCSG